MRALGAALVLLGAAGGYLLRRREQLLPVRLGRALLEDLAVLDYQIRFRRRPLPALLAGMEGLGARWLWQPLAEALERQEAEGLPGCWARAAAGLPPPLDRYLAPLGAMVPAGGACLAAAIEETREELTGFLREEAARQDRQGRLTAALCLSGASLLILVLI